MVDLDNLTAEEFFKLKELKNEYLSQKGTFLEEQFRSYCRKEGFDPEKLAILWGVTLEHTKRSKPREQLEELLDGEKSTPLTQELVEEAKSFASQYTQYRRMVVFAYLVDKGVNTHHIDDMLVKYRAPIASKNYFETILKQNYNNSLETFFEKVEKYKNSDSSQ